MKLTELRNLYDLGFSFLWVHHKSKKPIELGWSKKARLDWEYLTKTHSGLYNVGVRTGETALIDGGGYLAIIDCDVRGDNPKHLQEMTWKLETLYPEWKEAPIVLSGRGGGSMHVYVKTLTPTKTYTYGASSEIVETLAPSSDITSRDREAITAERLVLGYRLKKAWEISVSGNGHQVVMPPSVHPDSGNEYVWQMGEPTSGDEIPWAAIGREDAKARREEDKAKASLTEIVDVDLDARGLDPDLLEMIRETGNEGDRSTNMFFVAQRLFKAGFDEDEVVSVLVDKRNAISEGAWVRRNTTAEVIAWVWEHTVIKAQAASPQIEFSRPMNEGVPLSDEAAAAQFEGMVSAGDWQDQLDRVGAGANLRPKESLKNVLMVLRNAAPRGIFSRDSFSMVDRYTTAAPWGDYTGEEIRDLDSSLIRHWIAETFRFEPPKERVDEAIAMLCEEYAFHPVRDYLNGLKWDGVARVDSWLTDFVGCESNDYTRAVGRKFLCAMTARVMSPGVKFDHVLILEGKQGVGKSRLAAALAGGVWHSDTFLNMQDKDSVLSLKGKWLVELGELASLARAEVNTLKAYITRTTDDIRPPYGKRNVKFPRQCVFMGTTNSSGYLKDETGGRRFWPVEVGFERVDVEGVERIRDQLFAEALDLWRWGETLYLDESTNRLAGLEQEARAEVDGLTELVEAFLGEADRKLVIFDADEFCLSELFAAMGTGKYPPIRAGVREDAWGVRRMSASLTRLGYKMGRKRAGDRFKRVWKR